MLPRRLRHGGQNASVGFRGWAAARGGRALREQGALAVGGHTPPGKPRPGTLPGRVEQWERDLHGHSSDRITVEHALADHKRWKQLIRWTHRRDVLPDTYRAIAGLVSDRTANA